MIRSALSPLDRAGGMFMNAKRRERRALIAWLSRGLPEENEEMGNQLFEWPDAEDRIGSAYQAAGTLLDMVGFWDAPEGTELKRQGLALLDMLSDPANPVPDEPWTFGRPPLPKEKRPRGKRPKRAPDLFARKRDE